LGGGEIGFYNRLGIFRRPKFACGKLAYKHRPELCRLCRFPHFSAIKKAVKPILQVCV